MERNHNMAKLFTCEICDHIFSEKHRIIPGSVGGTYEKQNVAYLCPNHHATVHYILRWKLRGSAPNSDYDTRRYFYTQEDKDFASFYNALERPYHHMIFELSLKNCKTIWELPRNVFDEKISMFFEALSEWRSKYGKSRRYLSPDAVKKEKQKEFYAEMKRKGVKLFG